VLVAGCGDGEPTPLAVVRAAASETTQADTARISMTMEAGGVLPGDDPAFSAEGVVDFSARRGRFTIDFAKITQGLVPGEAEYLVDGTTIYFRFPPAVARELPDDKVWWRFDFDDVGKELGIDLESLASLQSNDPTAVLQFLRGSGEVTEVGRETLRGADTTHYRATLDLARARESVPEDVREAYDQATATLGVDTLPAEIWVDEEGRMRKLTFSVDLSKAKLPDGASASGVLHMTMELYDFGVRVDVAAPPADQVGELRTLIEAQQKGS
jgi:hypothetical protein